MIENLIHTVSKENNPSQYGTLQATHSKNETGLEGKFRALFQSLKSESEILEDSLTEQDLVDENNKIELMMDESPASMKRSDGGSEALNNVEKEESVDQNRTGQKTESASEKSDLAKITVHDESIAETEMSRTKMEGDSSEIREANVSGSGDQKDLDNSDSDSKNEREEIENVSKENTGPESERESYQVDSSQSLENENSRSKIPAKSQIRREAPSAGKESLPDSDLKINRSSSDNPETENRVDANDSRSASKAQTQNNTESTKESADTISFGIEKPDQSSREEISIAKQETAAGQIGKRESEGLKTESNEFRRFINVDEGPKTDQMSGKGLGTALQPEGAKNEVINPVEPKETVSPSDEKEQFKVKGNSSSTDLRSSEVYTQKSQDGESAREKAQATVREPKRDHSFTAFNNGVSLNPGDKQYHGATLNHGETRLYTDAAEKSSDRIINENIEKPIRIAQKPVESTVLIQDKVQPKRERNDVSFLNNNESKEFSRLTLPGIGVDATKQSASFSSGQLSENFGDLSESEKNEILWKEYNAEMDKSDELNRSELSASALAKLGDSTLSNHFLRRVLLPGLTQTVLTASGQSDRAENWQRHNFILEDGSKVQLSARKVDGVLQIKLGASIGELSKLLQIHQDEIREHLEKECNIKIDLQFEQGSGDQDQSSLDNFFGESTKKPVFDAGNKAENQTKKSIKKQLHTVVTRNFGYNSKEWTA